MCVWGEAAGALRGNRGRETSFAVARRANYVPGWVSFKGLLFCFPPWNPRKNYCLKLPPNPPGPKQFENRRACSRPRPASLR